MSGNNKNYAVAMFLTKAWGKLNFVWLDGWLILNLQIGEQLASNGVNMCTINNIWFQKNIVSGC